MALTWSDLADHLESRARRLGLPDDIGDLLLGAYGCLQGLVETYDIAAYTVHNDAIFATLTGERTYSLPDDFGRLLHPRDELAQGVAGTGQSGLFLYDGTNRPFPLRYLEPVAFRQQQSTDTRRPTSFTLAGRQLLLEPAPDANSGTPYLGQGVYIARVERPDMGLEDEVLLDEPQFLVGATLYQIAADRGLAQAGSLEKEHMRQLSALANNAARARQKFFTNRWPMRAYR